MTTTSPGVGPRTDSRNPSDRLHIPTRCKPVLRIIQPTLRTHQAQGTREHLRDRPPIQPLTVPHMIVPTKDEHGDVLVLGPDRVQEELPLAIRAVDRHVPCDDAVRTDKNAPGIKS